MAVKLSGDGGIEGITSFNGGGLTFRNILYNGWVNTSSEINQRGKTISQVSNGEYFADRWERVSSTTMTQKVEEGNYIPNRTYTLSGNNVTTTQITSPASGTWDWGTVPSNASLVQLELGDTPSAFEYRPKGLELVLCYRYYQTFKIWLDGTRRAIGGISGRAISQRINLEVPFRTQPTFGTISRTGYKNTGSTFNPSQGDNYRSEGGRFISYFYDAGADSGFSQQADNTMELNTFAEAEL